MSLAGLVKKLFHRYISNPVDTLTYTLLATAPVGLGLTIYDKFTVIENNSIHKEMVYFLTPFLLSLGSSLACVLLNKYYSVWPAVKRRYAELERLESPVPEGEVEDSLFLDLKERGFSVSNRDVVDLVDFITSIEDKRLEWRHRKKLLVWDNNFFSILSSPKDIRDYFSASVTEALSDKHKAWVYSRLGRDAADMFDVDRADAYLMHAIISTSLQSSTAHYDWRDYFDVVSDVPIERLGGETRNVVARHKGGRLISGSVCSKISDDLDALLWEMYRTHQLRKNTSVNVPYPFNIVGFGDKYLYAMRLVDGEELEERFLRGKKVPWADVVDTIASGHKYSLEGERKDLREDIEHKLFERADLPSRLKRRIWDSLGCVLDYLGSDDRFLVQNFDSHGKNILLAKKKVYLIDLESSQFVPAQFDLVNLFYHTPGIPGHVIARGVERYCSQVRIDESREEFDIGFYLSVPLRAISWWAGWSSEARRSMRPHAARAGVDALWNLSVRHDSFFEKHASGLDALFYSFKDVEDYYRSQL